MKVVKINKDYYGVIEDTDDLEALIAYSITVYGIDGTSFSHSSVPGSIKRIDELGRIHCGDGDEVILPEIDDFEVQFSIIPSIISESRFRLLCEKAKINYRNVAGISYDIEYILNSNNYDTIKEEVNKLYG